MTSTSQRIREVCDEADGPLTLNQIVAAADVESPPKAQALIYHLTRKGDLVEVPGAPGAERQWIAKGALTRRPKLVNPPEPEPEPEPPAKAEPAYTYKNSTVIDLTRPVSADLIRKQLNAINAVSAEAYAVTATDPMPEVNVNIRTQRCIVTHGEGAIVLTAAELADLLKNLPRAAAAMAV